MMSSISIELFEDLITTVQKIKLIHKLTDTMALDRRRELASRDGVRRRRAQKRRRRVRGHPFTTNETTSSRRADLKADARRFSHPAP